MCFIAGRYDIKGSWENRNAVPAVEGHTVTCTHCGQKYVYRKSARSGRMKRALTTASESGSVSGTGYADTQLSLPLVWLPLFFFLLLELL